MSEHAEVDTALAEERAHRRRLARSTAIFGAATALSRVLGLLREMVALPIRSGMSLLAVLVATAPRVDESPAARRKFFHAARAFVSLHRA